MGTKHSGTVALDALGKAFFMGEGACGSSKNADINEKEGYTSNSENDG